MLPGVLHCEQGEEVEDQGHGAGEGGVGRRMENGGCPRGVRKRLVLVVVGWLSWLPGYPGKNPANMAEFATSVFF
jgi:hypothetical protein